MRTRSRPHPWIYAALTLLGMVISIGLLVRQNELNHGISGYRTDLGCFGAPVPASATPRCTIRTVTVTGRYQTKESSTRRHLPHYFLDLNTTEVEMDGSWLYDQVSTGQSVQEEIWQGRITAVRAGQSVGETTESPARSEIPRALLAALLGTCALACATAVQIARPYLARLMQSA